MRFSLILVTLFYINCSFSKNSKDIVVPENNIFTFTLNKKKIEIIPIDTGRIQIKDCHFSNCLSDDNSYPRRLFSVVSSSEPASEKLPIYAYLIKHPLGNFLIDTGGDIDWDNDESWSCSTRGRFLSKKIAKVEVNPNQDILFNLKKYNSENDINSIIITHGHFDHTANLKRIDAKYKYIGEGDILNGDKIGAIECKFLSGLDLKKVNKKDILTNDNDKINILFEQTPFYLTKDNSLRIYSVPGHTPGSLVISLKTDQGDIFFIGDISFKDTEIEENSNVPGMHFNIKMIREVHTKLREYTKVNTSLLVPSHDKDINLKINKFRYNTN
jgi:N-acyl homoserine lactone hydrolase